MENLREKAENIYHSKGGEPKEVSVSDLQQLIEELQVHQIELELQNEELRNSKLEIEIARHKYFNLFDMAPTAYLIVDEKAIITELNLKACEITAKQKKHAIGHPFVSLLASESMTIFYEKMEYAKKNRLHHSFELLLQNKESDVFIDVSIMKWDQNLFLININDVTKSKYEKELIKTNEAYLRTLIDTTQEGFWIVNNKGKFVDVNQTYCNMSGYSRDEFLRLGINDVDASESQDETKRRMEKIVKQGCDVFESRHKGKNGNIFQVEIAVSYIPDRGGEFVCFSRDITQRKMLEQKLERNRLEQKKQLNLLNTLIQTLPLPLFYKDAFGKYLGCNPAFEKVTGKWEGEIIGKTVFDLWPEELAGLYQEKDKKLLQNPGHQTYEAKLYGADRQIHDIVFDKAVFYDENDRPAGIVGVYSDITDRKKMEQELRESEERFKALHDASFGGISIHDQGLILDCNKGMADLTGYSMDELCNMNGLQLIAPEAREIVANNIQTGYDGHYETIGIKKGGEKYPLLIQAKNIPYRGKMVRVVEFRDISEQKKAELLIREMNGNLEKALMEARQKEKEISGLLMATHGILETNDFEISARKIFDACKQTIGARAGYVALLSPDGSENELLFLDDGGLPCTVNKNLPMPIRGLREEAYKRGRAVFENDFMNTKWAKFLPKGHMVLPNILFAPLNLNGKTVGIIGVSHKEGGFTQNDARIAEAFGEYASIALHNSKQFYELKKHAEELKNLNATKDKLFSIIGHDLKGPLSNILGFSQLLSKPGDYSADKSLAFTEAIYKSALSINALLDNLLQWARLQQFRVVVKPEPFSPFEIFEKVSEFFKTTAELKKIRIENKIDPSLKIRADVEMVTTVARNLVSNAIKFTPEGGEVRFEAGIENSECTIWVIDNGVGMDPDVTANLFIQGQNKSSAGTSGEKGTGLGLLICKEFIEKNNGKIGLASIPGTGSSFFISLPMAI